MYSEALFAQNRMSNKKIIKAFDDFKMALMSAAFVNLW